MYLNDGLPLLSRSRGRHPSVREVGKRVAALVCWLLVVAVCAGVALAWRRGVCRRRRARHVVDDAEYVAALATLCQGSVRRHFHAYGDIDWDDPDFSVTTDDPRWTLPSTDALGRHPWYRAQSRDRQIAIGLIRQANIAKVAAQFESILVRGLLGYAFRVPNQSPEFRYCVHESIEECNHMMMFQEMVNRTGADLVGMPRWLRMLSSVLPLAAGPMPHAFFFGVLAGEVPFDRTQTNILRESAPSPPVLERIVAIHVAEEARHIAFAHSYLGRNVPLQPRFNRFMLALYVPVVMRLLCDAFLVPPRSFFARLGIPRSVRRQAFFGDPASRQALRDMFNDTRMLCHEVGLMNPVARLMWRACRISGRPARYRGEPARRIADFDVEEAVNAEAA